MKKVILIFGVAFLFFGCGPDLNPVLYDVKSILYSNFEEYTFSYQANKLIKVEGTDTTSVDYTYYTDSISLRFQRKNKIDHEATLFFSANNLTKI